MTYQINQVPKINDFHLNHPNLKAILWDLDGTVVNTEIAHMEAIVCLLNENCQIDKDVFNLKYFLDNYIGISDDHIYEEILKDVPVFKKFNKVEFLNLKEEYLQKIIKASSLNKLINSEVLSFIQEIAKSNISQCIVTNSNKISAENIINKLELSKYFKYIFTREDYESPKPSPFPYQLALKKLNISNLDVVAFEDSNIGHASATSAKICTYKVSWYEYKD